MGKILLKDCKFMITAPTPQGIQTGLSLLIKDDKIIKISKYEEMSQEELQGTEEVDCSNKFVSAGLVDGHNHLCNTHMNIARAFRLDYSNITEHMLTTIHDPYGWLDEEKIYDITMAAILNDVKHGATTLQNSTILPDAAFKAMDETKIRGILSPQMATSFRLDADNLNWKQSLEKTKYCLEQYHQPDKLIQVAVHVHDLWDCAESFMHKAYELAEQYDTKYVTHFWEFKSAVDQANALWKQEGGAFKHYLDAGLITDRCVFFHGSMLGEREIELLSETKASIIHNPDINGTNCGNCAYIPYMIEKGVNVGLGCDYGSLDMMGAMKLMMLVHHIMPRENRTIAYHQPFYAATMGSAEAYGLSDVGSLEVGKKADVITIDLTKATHLLPMTPKLLKLQPELLYFLFTRNCAGTETSETIIDGIFIRKNGEFTFLDEEKITANAYKRCDDCMEDLIAANEEGRHYSRVMHPDFLKDEDIDLEDM